MVLIHFSKAGSGKNSSLRNLTGMTESGVAKMIYQMKKKGLILRRGMNHYILTDKAQAWIAQALTP